jgi:hypothetical protein
MSTLSYLVNSTLAIEKQRVASQVRLSHLKLNNKSDPDTEAVHQKLVEVEEFIDGRIADHLKVHPAYPWFSRVKGIGLENIGKIIGLVRVEPEDYLKCNECKGEVPANLYKPDDLCPTCKTGHLKEPPWADTISSLWMFAGLGVDKDGKAPKRKAGEKLGYNSQLRSMCWRVGSSLLKAKGKFYEYYLSQKDRLTIRLRNEGIKIVPATQLPKVDGKKQEDAEHISEGHVHNMALRKMIKLFTACLWLEWRKGLNLPVTKPYAIDILKHNSFIDPQNMVDKD